MAKISQLPALYDLTGTEFVPVVKDGKTMRANVGGLVAGAVAGTVDNLKVDAVAYIGRPGNAQLVNGTAASNGAIYFRDVVENPGMLQAIEVYDKAAGTVRVAVYRGAPSNLTRIALTSVTTIGAGASRKLVLTAPIPLLAGDILAVQTSAAGILSVAEVQSGNGGYTYSYPDLPTTIALDAPTTNGQVQVRFVIAYRKQIVTADTFSAATAIKIVAPRAVALSSDVNPRGYLEWKTTGQPTAHTVKWGTYTVTLDAQTQRMEFPNYSLAQPYAFIGNSLTDSTDVLNRWSQLLAAQYGQPMISVARYSSDWRMVYRVGARAIVLTLTGALPAAGMVAVSKINGAAIDKDNPAAFLTTGDASVVSGMAMSGYLTRNGVTRRATVSAPNGASFDYVVTQAPGQTAITFDGPVTFVPDFAMSVPGRICVIWLGNNYFFSGVPNTYGDYTNPQMWVDLKLIVAFLQARGCRVLLLPVIPSADWTARGAGTPYTAMESANARTEAMFPGLMGKHADGRALLPFLQSRNDGSPGALDDVAKGFTPRNLRLKPDGSFDLLHMYGDGAGDRAVKDFADSALQAQALPNAITQTIDFVISAIGGGDQAADVAVVRVGRDPVTVAIQDTAQQVIAGTARAEATWQIAKYDMTSLADTDGIASEGLPRGAKNPTTGEYYHWAKNPAGAASAQMYGITPPDGWNAMTPWLQVYPEADKPFLAKNTRVECRNLSVSVLSKSTGAWYMEGLEEAPFGTNFVENFTTNAGGISANNRREISGGTSSVLALGYALHAYGRRRVTFPVNDIAAIYSSFEVRLIVDNPNLPDDRDQANYVASGGVDYWRSTTAPPTDGLVNNGPAMMGRFKRVTKDWRMVSSCTLSPTAITEASSVPEALVGEDRYRQYAIDAAIARAKQPRAFASAEIDDSSSNANLIDKRPGAQAWDSGRVRPLWASGSSPTSPWVDMNGAVVTVPFNAYRGWSFAADFKASIFRSAGTLSRDITQMPGFAYSGAGARYELSAGGVLLPIAANKPSIVPDVGYWSRPAFTNKVQNSKGAGGTAGVGSASLPPTRWSFLGDTDGVQRTVTYAIDGPSGATVATIRWAGTNTSAVPVSPRVQFEPGSGATKDQAWAVSAVAAIVAGTAETDGRAPALVIEEQTAAGAPIISSSKPIAAAASRAMHTRTLTSPDTARVVGAIGIVVAPGGSCDVTVSVMLPQMGLGRTAMALTDNSNSDRYLAADALQMTGPLPVDEDFFLVVRASWPAVPNPAGSGNAEVLLSINDGTYRNELALFRGGGTGSLTSGVVTAGSGIYRNSQAVVATGTGTIALRRKAGVFTTFGRGADGITTSGSSGTVQAMPSGLQRIELGTHNNGERANASIEMAGWRRGSYTDEQVGQLLRQI